VRVCAAVVAVTEAIEQLDEFLVTSVDVADHVEGAVLIASISPETLALNDGRVDVVFGLEHVDVAESLALEALYRTSERLSLAVDDVSAEIPVGTRFRARLENLLWQVEDDCNGKHVMLTRELEEWLSRLALHACGVDHCEPTKP